MIFFFYFLSFSAFPNLFWLEKKLWWCFPKFWSFFLFFFGISYSRSGRNASERFFFSLSFSAFPVLFWLEKKLWWSFLVFWIFWLFFWNFPLRVGKEHIGTIFFLCSLFLHLSHPILASKEAMMVFYNFLNFFAIFLEFSIMGRVGKHRNDFS